ncbi:hypothetical protein HY285_03115 [Candidatus Peregrinibacteria bacterium]|nr:hypothetical protein [Candidatus Peregrinibacteria bacterium]MBI3816506.1 hypothetical protein [Candidatus Peregrinibacteria bacterium]
MRHLFWFFLLLIGSVVVISYISSSSVVEPAKNPDPNHAHADFAVWINGKKLDFSAQKYMTTDAEEAKLKPGDVRLYLHLHDGDGHVIHRHKPELTFGNFLETIGLKSALVCPTRLNNSFPSTSNTCQQCLNVPDYPFSAEPLCGWRMFVNGKERPLNLSYVFADGDHLLLTNANDAAEVQKQLSQMTDDACLYSRTCPERGKPPTENCIADPTVPCREVT